jgi:hypothetical protein
VVHFTLFGIVCQRCSPGPDYLRAFGACELCVVVQITGRVGRDFLLCSCWSCGTPEVAPQVVCNALVISLGSLGFIVVSRAIKIFCFLHHNTSIRLFSGPHFVQLPESSKNHKPQFYVPKMRLPTFFASISCALGLALAQFPLPPANTTYYYFRTCVQNGQPTSKSAYEDLYLVA